jgi:hypothetical protein
LGFHKERRGNENQVKTYTLTIALLAEATYLRKESKKINTKRRKRDVTERTANHIIVKERFPDRRRKYPAVVSTTSQMILIQLKSFERKGQSAKNKSASDRMLYSKQHKILTRINTERTKGAGINFILLVVEYGKAIFGIAI